MLKMNDDMDNGELLYLIMKSNKVYLNGVLIKSKWDDTLNAYETLELNESEEWA